MRDEEAEKFWDKLADSIAIILKSCDIDNPTIEDVSEIGNLMGKIRRRHELPGIEVEEI